MRIVLKGTGRGGRGMLATCLPQPSSQPRTIDTPCSGRCKEAEERREAVPVAAAGAVSPLRRPAVGPRLRPPLLRGGPGPVDETLAVSRLQSRSYGPAAAVLAALPIWDGDDPPDPADENPERSLAAVFPSDPTVLVAGTADPVFLDVQPPAARLGRGPEASRSVSYPGDTRRSM